MNRLLIVFGSLLVCLSLQLHADETGQVPLEDVPAPPDLPDPIESGEVIEPEVTIIQRDDATIEEYRINGQLYMVKVTPVVGPPYYLIDNDGNGSMETRSNIYTDVTVPQWILFTWN